MLISHSPRPVSTLRVVLKDFTFSDGVLIPAGTFICLPLYATHHDEQKYPNPFTFDPSSS
jgi:cytochrome P450